MKRTSAKFGAGMKEESPATLSNELPFSVLLTLLLHR